MTTSESVRVDHVKSLNARPYGWCVHDHPPNGDAGAAPGPPPCRSASLPVGAADRIAVGAPYGRPLPRARPRHHLPHLDNNRSRGRSARRSRVSGRRPSEARSYRGRAHGPTGSKRLSPESAKRRPAKPVVAGGIRRPTLQAGNGRVAAGPRRSVEVWRSSLRGRPGCSGGRWWTRLGAGAAGCQDGAAASGER